MGVRNWLKSLKIGEISLVDDPANPGAVALLAKRREDDKEPPYWEKRNFTQDQRDHATKTGAAMPDGSFPIENASDLENAMQAIGRAKDPTAARAHIRSRAKALGLTDKLSDSFNKSEMTEAVTAFAKTVHSILCDEKADHQKALGEAAAQFHTHVEGLIKSGTAGIIQETPMPETITKADHDAAVGVLKTQVDDLTKKLTGAVSADHLAYGLLLKTKPRAEFFAKTADERDAVLKAKPKPDKKDMAEDPAANDNDEDDMKKYMASLPEPVRKRLEQSEVDHVELAKLRDAQELIDFAKQVGDSTLTAAELRDMHKQSPELAKSVLTKMVALAKQAKDGGLFTEFGKTSEGIGTDGSALAELNKATEVIMKANASLTRDRAFMKACEANPDLYTRYTSEQRTAATRASA